jgi:hypothetical protein
MKREPGECFVAAMAGLKAMLATTINHQVSLCCMIQSDKTPAGRKGHDDYQLQKAL